ncbi:hypothetical protein Q4Q39_05445 [Flavivirga amylovorans]|uniref:Uncharacterized protein n=1 Tax=Flavivirga amylovorans TaxID=870486 RepID=A0ABT8WYY9_9FLAO|nr:hypothetical protein [Flavivirga amylovorans]MDO5986847.1 hypothetical protein [Flavivirga amylovorans]
MIINQRNLQRLLFILLLSLSFSLSAQNAYYDALKIDFLEEKYKEFKSKAGISATEINTIETQILKDKNNYDSFLATPFSIALSKENIESIRKSIVINDLGVIAFSSNFVALADQAANPATSNLFSIPVSAQSAIIDGTAKFLAERFKEDITTLYINKFREKLESIPELKALYPKTFSFLKTADVFNYRSLGNDFKEAFEEDLKNILSNLGIYINDNANLKAKLIASKVYYPFDFTLALSDKLINGYHPVEILDYLESRYKSNPDVGFSNYYNITHGLNILQKNLQRKKSDEPSQSIELVKPFENIWLRFSDLKKINTADKIKYFTALIYNQDRNYFSNVLKIDANNVYDFFNNTIYPIAGILNDIENIQSKGKSMTADDYVGVMSNTLKLLKYINGKEEIGFRVGEIKFTGKDGEEVIIDVLDLMDKMVDLYKSIQNKDYGYIVTNGLYVTEKILLASGESKANIIKVTQVVSKYGGFMVDVVTADNSDEVKDAIKKNVTKFSFLDKRNSLFSLTISGHPGIYGGVEELTKNNTSQANFGITAPIGFEFMWGFRTCKGTKNKQYAFVNEDDTIKYLSGHAWSIFVSFADIGAAFNYRLNDTESELPQELTFKQIFSPGVSINYGFRNSPITLGAGIQYSPELRKVTVENIETGSNSLRAMLRLSWDIPLIKIYSKHVKK